MARQTQPLEVSSFVRGLITEASPLTFPENASLDEDNFNLRRDGSRDRRLGMDFENGYQTVTTSVSVEEANFGVSSFVWKNAGGVAEKSFLVVQTGSQLKVFDSDISPLSSGEVYSFSFSTSVSEKIFSYTVVDGVLVVATGEKEVRTFVWDGTTFTSDTIVLEVRDQFGVEDVFSGKDLFSGNNLTLRPSSLTDAHTYNLRNQTWGLPKEQGGTGHTIIDPISRFNGLSGVFPSNADNINYAVYANANNSSNRTGDQFYAKDLQGNPPGSFPSPKGFFIIDALERGQSRLEKVQDLYTDNPVLAHPIASLPTDKTPGGATSVQEYAGRVWYGGFSGDIVGGDDRSPRMSSYVLYSTLVNNPSDVGKCYQEGDPTSKEAPDLLDTDGGFIRIDGAYNIQALVNVGQGLMVVAENGVWMITGGSDFGFTANNNMRRKITEHGVQSPGSVVVADNTFMFWADDAIYHVAPDQFGDWVAQNLTQTTIQTFYDDIPPIDKFYAQGAYDSYDRKVRWLYRNRASSTDSVRELIFDITLGAFYTHTIGQINGGVYPRPVCPVEVPPFRLNETTSDVVYKGDPVVYNGDQVTQNVSLRGSGTRELAYITLLSASPVSYTFSLYRDPDFKDWVSFDTAGVDAPAFLVTGYLSGGDFLRYKQAPYIQFHLTRTEDGFEDDGTGNLFPTNQSSCIVQAQWEWANSANSNRWGRPFQAYRYRRLYMPSGVSDPFDNGFEVVTTKNKLRGKGKVLSLKITTEPEKDCRLLGWSMLVSIPNNV